MHRVCLPLLIGAWTLLSACAEPPPEARPGLDRFRALANFAVTLEESILHADANHLVGLLLPDVAAVIEVPNDLAPKDQAHLRRASLLQKWRAILELNRSVELQAGALERIETTGVHVVVPFFRRHAGGGAQPVLLRVVYSEGRFGLDRKGEQQLIDLLEPTEAEAQELAHTVAVLANVVDLLTAWHKQHPGASPKGWSEVLPTGSVVPRDAWGQELILGLARGRLVVTSVGPDGEPGTHDDLSAP